MAVNPIPEGYPSVTPYLIVDGGADAIAFYTNVFDATERMRLTRPGGSVAHAELCIGDAVFMLADEFPDMGFVGPRKLGGTPVSMFVYVEDVDASFERAIAAGAIEKKPVADQFYGDRMGTLEDPFGHMWSIASRTENVSPEEMQKRFDKMISEGSSR